MLLIIFTKPIQLITNHKKSKKMKKLSLALALVFISFTTTKAQNNGNVSHETMAVIESIAPDGKSGIIFNPESGKRTDFTIRGQSPVNIGDKVKLIIINTAQRPLYTESCGITITVSHPSSSMDGHAGSFFWAVVSIENSCLI